MENKKTIEKFYKAFANGDAKTMLECYHTDVVFEDPAFGRLEGLRAHKMWEMLLSQKKADTSIIFSDVEASVDSGRAQWIAKYQYGDKKRKVTNTVSARFKFKEGKIIEHIDTFDLWRWTQQALGASGYLLGWTSFMKKKIQSMTSKRLDTYMGR